MTWFAPTSNGGADIDRYTVTAHPGGATCTTGGGLTCTVRGLTNGIAYSLAVQAHNSQGDGPPANASTSVTPTAPTTVVAVTISPRSPTGALLTTTGLGDDFVYHVEVANTGAAAATAVNLTVPLSPDHRLLAIPSGCSSASRSGPVTCELGTLAGGARRSFDVAVEAAFDCDIYGDSGGNTLRGTSAGEIICGGGGADRITGGGGNDVIFGYGNRRGGIREADRVSTGAHVTFGPGSQTGDAVVTVIIEGSDGADVITAGGGTDRIFSEEGNDVINAGAGGTTTAAQLLNGGAGDDVITGGSGVDLIIGGAGDDTVRGGPGADAIFGNDGLDNIAGGEGDDAIHGGPGTDVVHGGGGNDEIFGDEGDDDLYGDGGDDHIVAGDGDDIALGGAGNDSLFGDDGHDYLDGGAGNDVLEGGYGRDVLRGNRDADTLDGGPTRGSATTFPADHWDRLYGDAGVDVCHVGPRSGADNTSYRDASCELRDLGVPARGQGWPNAPRPRLDRGVGDPVTYPG